MNLQEMIVPVLTIGITPVGQAPRYPYNGEKTMDKGADKLRNTHYWMRSKNLEKYSVAKLESLVCKAPISSYADNAEKEFVEEILSVRWEKLNREFEWSKENIKRLVTVKDMFLKRWEEGVNRAKSMMDLLCGGVENKADFNEHHVDGVKIQLAPYIFLQNKETGEFEYPLSGIYPVLMDYNWPGDELSSVIDGLYYSETKDDSGFRENIHLCRDTSWNIEGFGDIELAEHYICYAMHILYSHYYWAIDDIMKINHIDVEVTISELV